MSREVSQFDWMKFILGASAIAGAVWLFTRSSSAKEGEAKPQPAPPPPSPKNPPLSSSSSYESPDMPGHEIFVPGGVPTVPSSSSSFPAPAPGEIGLRSGKKYRARLQLTGFEKLGSRGQIADTFSGLGFSDVAVYMNQAELPGGAATWPAPSSDGGARWAEGVWNKSDENLTKPPQVVEVRQVA